MDRYGYDTYDGRTYCLVDLQKNEHIGTVFHVTTADLIVDTLNRVERMHKVIEGHLAENNARPVG